MALNWVSVFRQRLAPLTDRLARPDGSQHSLPLSHTAPLEIDIRGNIKGRPSPPKKEA